MSSFVSFSDLVKKPSPPPPFLAGLAELDFQGISIRCCCSCKAGNMMCVIR
jgi:hypothetical protein